MWVILQNNAGWDCFKTLTSQEILKIQNPTSGGTLCVFGSHTFAPEVGCVRNKFKFHTVQQNPKSSLWTLD